MPNYDSLMLVQMGDVSIHGHQTEHSRPELTSRGKAEEMLLSNKVLLPSRAGVKARSLDVEGVVYASHGRSRAQMVNHIESLFDRTVDVIACEFLQGGFDSPAGNGYYPVVNNAVLWLHSVAHISEISISDDNDSMEFKAELTLDSFWQALSPAEWFTIRRNESRPQLYEKASFEIDDINPLPSADTFFQDEQPFSFHKRFYLDTSYHFDPTYFVALSDYHDDDVPDVRYTSDWMITESRLHNITVDKLRWSGDPLSVYFFKNLTSASTVTIDVTHDDGMWRRATTRTSFDATAIDSAMTSAGFTLVDSDILAIGHISGSATVIRNDINILNVADLISRDGGNSFGQIYRGDNVVKVRGATYAAHHIFRRF